MAELYGMSKREKRGPDYGKQAFSGNIEQSLDISGNSDGLADLRDRLKKLASLKLNNADDAVFCHHIAWGVKHDEVNARQMPIIDTAGHFSSTTVEKALQELGGLLDGFTEDKLAVGTAAGGLESASDLDWDDSRLEITGTVQINQVGCTSDPWLQARGSSIAHGMTDYMLTDSFFGVDIISGSLGGALVMGAAEGGGRAMEMRGLLGGTCAGMDALRFVAGKKNSTYDTLLADNEIVASWYNYTSRKMALYGNGYLGINDFPPECRLHVNDGSVTSPTALSTGTILCLERSGTSGVIVEMRTDSTTSGLLKSNTPDNDPMWIKFSRSVLGRWMEFNVNGTEYLRLDEVDNRVEINLDAYVHGDLTVNGNDILDSGGAAAITFDGSQRVGVGRTPSSGKFEVYQAAVCPSEPWAEFTQDGVSHGITDYLQSDAFFAIDIIDESTGGALLVGAAELGYNALEVRGILGGTCAAQIALKFVGSKKSGTGDTSLADDELIATWYNSSSLKMLLYGNGDLAITAQAATTDTDKFCVIDGNIIKYRTGAQLLSDIGGASGAHAATHHSGGSDPLTFSSIAGFSTYLNQGVRTGDAPSFAGGTFTGDVFLSKSTVSLMEIEATNSASHALLRLTGDQGGLGGYLIHYGSTHADAGTLALKNADGDIAFFVGASPVEVVVIDTSGNMSVTGNVTGANLNISNWDTAYGWGDHSLVGYLTSVPAHASTHHSGGSDPLAFASIAGFSTYLDQAVKTTSAPTFAGGSFTGDVSITRSVGTSLTVTRTSNTAISLNASASAYGAGLVSANKIFFTANNDVTNPHVVIDTNGSVSMSGTLSVTGNVTGANLNISNWDTAYGWGDHAGLYALATHAATHESGGADTVNHDSLVGFVANEHINHTLVTLTAGNGLTGGGTIAANRTFTVGAGTGISVAADSVAFDTAWGDARYALTSHTHAIITDADGDTKIQVEEGADDDTARIDAGGSEVATFTSALATLNTDLTLAAGTQDYKLTSRSVYLSIRGLSHPGDAAIELWPSGPSNIADGGDGCYHIFWAKGDPTNIVDYERFTIGYRNTGTEMILFSEAGGTGTVRPIKAYTGSNTNQLFLATDGKVGVGAGTPGGRLDVYQAGCTSDLWFLASDDSVAHGMTDYMPTRSFFGVDIISSSFGGADIIGASESGRTAMILRSLQGGTPAEPAMRFIGSKQNTTYDTAIANSDVLARWDNYTTAKMTLYGSGKLDAVGGFAVNGTDGWSGTFTDGAAQTVTVTNGIITNVA